jgi:anthranilate synthase component 1
MSGSAGSRGGLIAWFACNHVSANLLMAFLLIGGIYVASTMNAQTFPDIDPRQVTVSVVYRGATPEEDRALADDLLADPKERAEHVMLIDLGRNDVGRVAAIGSVELSDVMTIERYSHVMHLTSNVTGRLRPELTAFDALRACLPAGTVSGAPKIRAMEIIDELEPVRRGPYAGAVGYIDFAGSMDTCIALRTIVVKDGRALVQSGAGIVADSVPESEFEETLNKARGLLVSLEMTADRLAAGNAGP